MTFHLSDLSSKDRYHYLQHSIAPRPIAFASTIDKEGNVNLSPFSYFNIFSAYPPIVVFSPSRRARNNTNKHTLENLEEVPEVVINIVDYSMVQQMSLTSCEFPKGVNEFIKAGFTEEKSTVVAPPMVKESKIKLECKVLEIKPLGTEGGAGNLVIAEILVIHIDESILNEEGKMIQGKIDHVARLGGDWYCRVTPENLFEVAKPNTETGIGVDELPENIRQSKILTGNDLGMLANVRELPEPRPAYHSNELAQIVQYYNLQPEEMETEIHKLASGLLKDGMTDDAWQVLLTTV